MWRIHVIFSVLLFNLFVKINGQDERCYSPSNTYGLCVILPKCPSLLSLYGRNQRDYQVIDYIETARRNCGSRQYGDSPIVCCQDPIITIQYPAGSIFLHQSEKPIRKPIQHSPAIRPPTYNTNLQPSGKSCSDPNGLNGICMNIKECPSVLNEFVARFEDSNYIEFIKRSNRYCDNIRPFICCPRPHEEKSENPLNGEHAGIQNGSKTRNTVQGRFLTPEEGCGYSNATHLRTMGPHRAAEGSWPWIALLGYENKIGEKSWECAGTLITTRHVLSSAFCVISTLSLARLGEYDISSTADGDVQDIKIIRSIKHPDYDSRDGTSDIAVLYLEHDTQLSLKVLPICMPISGPIRSQSFTNYKPFIAGWGHLQGGNSSTVLQESQLTVLDNKNCRDRYQEQGKLFSSKQFSKQVLCAGDILGGRDSCESDSGGPLMLLLGYKDQLNFYQIGIVSYNIPCIRTDVPAVYTNVQYFVDWIQERVNS